MSKFSLLSLITEIISDSSIPELILKRVPFLKSYDVKIYEKDTLHLQKSAISKEIKVPDDEYGMVGWKFTLFSDFKYSKRIMDNNIFYIFSLENEFFVPESEKGLPTMMRHATNIIGHHLTKKLKFNEEIIIKKDENIDDSKLNDIINRLNQKFFELEDFANEHYIKFF